MGVFFVLRRNVLETDTIRLPKGGLVKTVRMLSLLVGFLLLAGDVRTVDSHEPSGKHETAHADNEETMKAQHARMARFKSAARILHEGIIFGNAKMAEEGASQLLASLEGHGKDLPHKNRSRIKEFHGLHIELGKRTENLRAAVRANDLPRAAIAYGRVLEICASCHRRFRD